MIDRDDNFSYPFIMVVHLKGEYRPEDKKLLKRLAGEVISFEGGPDTEVVVAGRVSPELAASFPKLKHVVIPFAGVPPVTLETIRNLPDVTLHNIHHNAAAAAEMAVSLILTTVKFLIPADSALREGDWRPRYIPMGKLIVDSRVTILGWGNIGKRIDTICTAMGASVTRVGRTAKENCRGVDDLQSILPKTDILIICVPMTDETKDMIGQKELSLLPRGASLVNIARGSVVQEEALFRSLESGHLGGAGLDVWYQYPQSEEERERTPPSKFDFSSLPNVVMSPHRGGAFGVEELEIKRMEHIASLLRALAEGDDSLSRINPDLGY